MKIGSTNGIVIESQYCAAKHTHTGTHFVSDKSNKIITHIAWPFYRVCAHCGTFVLLAPRTHFVRTHHFSRVTVQPHLWRVDATFYPLPAPLESRPVTPRCAAAFALILISSTSSLVHLCVVPSSLGYPARLHTSHHFRSLCGGVPPRFIT